MSWKKRDTDEVISHLDYKKVKDDHKRFFDQSSEEPTHSLDYVSDGITLSLLVSEIDFGGTSNKSPE